MTSNASPFGRPDLFTGVRYTNPPVFTLHPDLTPGQRAEALAIAKQEYPPIAYGTTLRGNEIVTYGAD